MSTYKLKVFCPNCEFRGEIEIEKGVPYDKTECTNCGVSGLMKDTPVVTDSYHDFDNGHAL